MRIATHIGGFVTRTFDALNYAVPFVMAQPGKLRSNIEYLFASVVLGFFSRLPLAGAISVGRSIGWAAMLVPKLRRTGQRNLALAFPDLDENERARLLRGCF